MYKAFEHIGFSVALLFLGSAILLMSCKKSVVVEQLDEETLMTMMSDTLTVIQSKNGNVKMRFTTPLMERYQLAKEPYMEFRRGVHVITYDDSTFAVASTLVADYAIFFENRELWEAKGNVVATNAEGQTLYTQQLFWNQKTHRVYSNVDSKITQDDDIFIGEGFESDDRFDKWSFRKFTGKLTVDTQPTQPRDSVDALPGPAASRGEDKLTPTQRIEQSSSGSN